MRLNDRGFVAMVDAMLFIVVIFMAAAVVTWAPDDGGTDDRDASGLLGDLMDLEVRMSDMAEGDDSLVRVSDLAALWLLTGEPGPADYLRECMDAYCKGRPYLLSLTFEGPDGSMAEGSLGSPSGTESSHATVTVPVTTGGTLTASLTLYLS